MTGAPRSVRRQATFLSSVFEIAVVYSAAARRLLCKAGLPTIASTGARAASTAPLDEEEDDEVTVTA